jgi:NAD(P)-dependent dehydrogenase (short-subunit alcohol dehydrogenase family)
MMDFDDKVCVTTGAGSGTGRALALELAGQSQVVDQVRDHRVGIRPVHLRGR